MLCLKSPKAFSSKTIVNSNWKCVIYHANHIGNLILNLLKNLLPLVYIILLHQNAI